MRAVRLIATTLAPGLLLHATLANAAPQAPRNAPAKAADKLQATAGRVLRDAPVAPAAPNMCLSFTYDKNGNRLTQTTAGLNAQAVWGSSTYPCFVWSAS